MRDIYLWYSWHPSTLHEWDWAQQTGFLLCKIHNKWSFFYKWSCAWSFLFQWEKSSLIFLITWLSYWVHFFSPCTTFPCLGGFSSFRELDAIRYITTYSPCAFCLLPSFLSSFSFAHSLVMSVFYFQGTRLHAIWNKNGDVCVHIIMLLCGKWHWPWSVWGPTEIWRMERPRPVEGIREAFVSFLRSLKVCGWKKIKWSEWETHWGAGLSCPDDLRATCLPLPTWIHKRMFNFLFSYSDETLTAFTYVQIGFAALFSSIVGILVENLFKNLFL